MFAESMILHALIESQAHSTPGTPANQSGKESSMTATTDDKTSMQQSQRQGQSQSQNPEQAQPPARSNFVDPLGRPMYQGTPRFTDQQAGGDLTGDESDARDDNYVETGTGQNARDVSAHASELPAASAELLRFVAVAPVVADAVSDSETPPQAVAQVEPDGTEDPGSNADDGLLPRKQDGTASEQH
ncbi:hypothetical protein DXT88_12935 [Herbaspirillum lusitanum]|uniref:hypothetical protein n=1 Tax=Herbaspirillum lusitanum TaxID=213312 RepID=UPI00223823EB|nr:hypothetical protein [Herbaspirillum lusitanum]MCW5299079.1 hypothetical protein [Herbaspirillum lusitanum]